MNGFIDGHWCGFRFWCQKVLPLTYDDSLSYYELLCKVVKYLNGLGETTNQLIDGLNELKEYVDHYFDTLDIEPYIDAKLEEMLQDGELEALVERIASVDYVTPDMFGAVGDGETDDTAAVQAAFDDGRAVCFLMDKCYLITSTIEIKKITRVKKVAFCKGQQRYSSKPNIKCRFAESMELFNVQDQSWTFENVSIDCFNGNEALDYRLEKCFVTNITQADIDFSIIGCFIDHSSTLMTIRGRGFLCEDCCITRCDKLMYVTWGGTDTGGVYHNAETGQRAYIVKGNRFHSERTTSPFVEIASGNVWGFEFSNNNFDRGSGPFLVANSDCDGWLISDNHFIGMAGEGSFDALMEFEGDLTNSVIANNIVLQLDTGTIKSFIAFPNAGSAVEGVIVTGNYMNRMSNGSFIVCIDGSIKGCSVCNNAIGTVESMSSARAFIRGTGITINDTSICNNSLMKAESADENDPNKFYGFYSSTSGTMKGVKIIGNTINDNYGSHSNSSGLTISDCLFDWTFEIQE